MKLHIDTDKKTIAIEGNVKVHNVFSYLMSWFPEEWEQWEFIPYTPAIQYKEIIVEREVYKQPYWNPFRYYGNPIYVGGTIGLSNNSTTLTNGTSFVDMSNPMNVSGNISNTADTKLTLNFNNLID